MTALPRAAPRRASRTVGRVARPVFALLALTALVAGLSGGLLRAGLAMRASVGWLGEAASAHAFLMICAFLGTLVGLERAVALKRTYAVLSPMLSGLSAVFVLTGHLPVAQWMVVCAA